MKSRTSFFNRTVFLKTFTSYWPVWALYLIVWILIMPVSLANNQVFFSIVNYSKNIMFVKMRYELLTRACYVGVVGGLLGGMAAACLIFSYTFSSRSGNFYASLPIRRDGLYLTNYLSGLCWFIVCNVIVFGLTALVTSGSKGFDIVGLCQWFAIVSLTMVVFYSMATFAAMISGNWAGFLLVYAALNCGLIICEFLIRMIGTMVLRGVNATDETFTQFLTPTMALMDQVESKLSSESIVDKVIYAKYTGWTMLFIYVGVAVVLVILGLLIYRKRHMETSSDLIAIKWMRPVFKYLFTFFCALVLGFILHAIIFGDTLNANIIPVTICMLIGAFVGYFGSSMLLNKSFRVFKKWPGYLVSAIVIIAVMTGVHFDVLGVERYVPEPENVKSVVVDTFYGNRGELMESKNITMTTGLHRHILELEEATGDLNALFDNNDNNSTATHVYVKYTLNSGRTVQRSYNIFADDKLYSMLDEVMNSPEAVRNRMTSKIPVNEQTAENSSVDGENLDAEMFYDFSLTPSQADELYNTCIIPDMEDGHLGRIDFRDKEVRAYFNVYIGLSLEEAKNGVAYDEDTRDSLNIYVTEEAARTWKYLIDNMPENAGHPMMGYEEGYYPVEAYPMG